MNCDNCIKKEVCIYEENVDEVFYECPHFVCVPPMPECKPPRVQTFYEELVECSKHLDEIMDVLDEIDETVGIPQKVGDAWDILWDYFMEMRKLNEVEE